MSGWTEYVIADREEGDAIANSNEPKRQWPGFEGFKFFCSAQHTALYQALGWDVGVRPKFAHVGIGDGGVVEKLPGGLVEALARVRDDQLPDVTMAWGQRLAALGDRYSGEQLGPLLRQLRALAVRAVAEGKPVLHWQASCE